MTKERISDLEILTIAMSAEPDVDEIKITDVDGTVKVFDVKPYIKKLPTSRFELHTADGLIFTGVLVSHNENSFKLRQDDGQLLHVLKRSVVAIRRARAI